MLNYPSIFTKDTFAVPFAVPNGVSYRGPKRGSIVYIVKHLCCEHQWDRLKCTDYRGVFISDILVTTVTTAHVHLFELFYRFLKKS